MDQCDSALDYIEVLIDDTQVWSLDGGDPSCGLATYSEVVVDISAFADGAVHELSFHAETFSASAEQDSSDFHVDDIFMPQGPEAPIPSSCLEELIFMNGFEL